MTEYKDTDLPNKCLHIVDYSMALLMQQYLWIYAICTCRKCTAKWYFYLINLPFSLSACVFKCDLRVVGFLDRVPYEMIYSKAFCCFGTRSFAKPQPPKTPLLSVYLQSHPQSRCWKFCSFLQCIRECLTGVFSKEKAPSDVQCAQCRSCSRPGSSCVLPRVPSFFFVSTWRVDVLFVRWWVCFCCSSSFLIWVILLEAWVQFSL